LDGEKPPAKRIANETGRPRIYPTDERNSDLVTVSGDDAMRALPEFLQGEKFRIQSANVTFGPCADATSDRHASWQECRCIARRQNIAQGRVRNWSHRRWVHS